MISLNQVSGSTPYLEVPAPCATPDGGSFLILLDYEAHDTGHRVMYDHIHTSGPQDSFGNKACTHYAYDGTLTILNESSKVEEEMTNVNYYGWPPFPSYRVYCLPCKTIMKGVYASGKSYTSSAPVIMIGSHGFVDLSYTTSRGARVTASLTLTRKTPTIFEMDYRCDGLANKPGDYWHNNPDPKDPWDCWGGGATYMYEKKTEIEILSKSDPRNVVYRTRLVREYERYWYFRGFELVSQKTELGPYDWWSPDYASAIYLDSTPPEALDVIKPALRLVDQLLDTTETSKTTADTTKDSLWSIIMVEALSSRKIIDCNLVMSLLELKNLSKDLTKTLENYKDVASGVVGVLKGKTKLQKQLAKDAASAHLSTIYGYNLTLKECEQNGISMAACLDNVRAALSYKQTLKARKQQYELWSCKGYEPTRATCNYSVTLRPEDNGFSAMYDYLDRFSAWVTLTDAWDFIPFSFVVDWLLPVGKMLEALDEQAWQANHRVDTVIKSMKIEARVDIDRAFPGILSKNLLNTGSIRATKYHRWRESCFDSPPLYPDVGSIPDVLRKHFPEGASLIVQRL